MWAQLEKSLFSRYHGVQGGVLLKGRMWEQVGQKHPWFAKVNNGTLPPPGPSPLPPPGGKHARNDCTRLMQPPPTLSKPSGPLQPSSGVRLFRLFLSTAAFAL